MNISDHLTLYSFCLLTLMYGFWKQVQDASVFEVLLFGSSISSRYELKKYSWQNIMLVRWHCVYHMVLDIDYEIAWDMDLQRLSCYQILALLQGLKIRPSLSRLALGLHRVRSHETRTWLRRTWPSPRRLGQVVQDSTGCHVTRVGRPMT